MALPRPVLNDGRALQGLRLGCILGCPAAGADLGHVEVLVHLPAKAAVQLAMVVGLGRGVF
jgi:hypothetical protein